MTDEVATLALSTAAGLGTVDIVYALRGRIAKIYLFDAVLELALIAAWARLAGMRIAPLGAIEGWTHGDRH